MGADIKDRWSIPITAVANEFIDSYMAHANGEYVKVYLYILRHQGEAMTVEGIADELNHTESDVRRALSYWKKAGVLMEGESSEGEILKEIPVKKVSGDQQLVDAKSFADKTAQPEVPRQSEAVENQRPVYSAEQVNRLSDDEEFSQLLYIAQKYLNKVFTPRDCQVFAYLYEGLGMSSELMEYLVEYCAQNGHTSVRYLEAVALGWYEQGIKTSEEAKIYCSSYTRDSFAVMKTFGLGGRKPAAPEQKLMDKWFKDYGFTREIVIEACSRTITAIHNPSFQYADKILTDWKKAGVKGLEDIKNLDRRRFSVSEEKNAEKEKRLQKYSTFTPAAKSGEKPRKASSNQFHNFKQRDTDYDALMMEQVKEWVEQQPR